jgi:uncharacterized membrane protein YtjA (UPF0391 family)
MSDSAALRRPARGRRSALIAPKIPALRFYLDPPAPNVFSRHPQRGADMLNAAILFLLIALIAAVLGFGGIAGTAAGIAKILFFVFLVLALISFFTGRRTPI